MSDDIITTLGITYEQSVVLFDAVVMLGAEAKRTLEDNDDLIAPLKREAEATVANCDSLADLIRNEFGFNAED